MKYRKTIIAEAVKFTGLKNDKYPKWLKKAIDYNIQEDDGDYKIYIDCNNSWCNNYYLFSIGDWLICEDGKDEDSVYPCDNETFKKTYKKVK